MKNNEQLIDYEDLLNDISLETRLKVLNEMFFINLLSELGYRKDKMWTDEENELSEKLFNLAKELTKNQIEEIKEWFNNLIIKNL